MDGQDPTMDDKTVTSEGIARNAQGEGPDRGKEQGRVIARNTAARGKGKRDEVLRDRAERNRVCVELGYWRGSGGLREGRVDEKATERRRLALVAEGGRSGTAGGQLLARKRLWDKLKEFM